MATDRPGGGAPGSPVPRLLDREDVARPGALRRAVEELEEILLEGGRGPVERPDPRLRELASPPVLASLFRLALVAAVRRGPGDAAEGPTPAGLLAAAAEAAAVGWLAVPALVALRQALAELEVELRARGVWRAAEPLWWQPLPAAGPLEELWRTLDEGLGGPLVPAPAADRKEPAADRKEPAADREAPAADREAPAASGEEPAWLHLPRALPPALLAPLQEGLERAIERGKLTLSPGGVGAADERSHHRNDAVAFLTGREPDLLAQVPHLAVLVQWLLARAGDRLGRALLPGRELFAPQTAMLARYRPPSSGFAPHLDNPGGADDNGRSMTAVLYLGAPGVACTGGELMLWPPATPGKTGEAESSLAGPPAAALPAAGGSAVLFDARRVPHAVRPLEAGPDRWTLVVWLNEASRRPPDEVLDVPFPDFRDVLMGVDDLPVVPGRVIFRELRGGTVPVEIAVHAVPSGPPPRVGVVTTVDPLRATGSSGAPALDGWVCHHLELGADHLLVIVDEPCGAEALFRVRCRLASIGGEAVTVWSAEEARRRWPAVDTEASPDRAGERVFDLRRQAGAGPAAWAVAARQSLNASAALAAARGDELGGRPLDWLVHLDADELLVLEGPGRGGACLAEHFAAARAAGLVTVRYADHELLLPWEPGSPLRFKANPLLAAARLGRAGWEKLVALLGLEQDGLRPYFRAYWNGKSAVAVEAGAGASGVHGWQAADPAGGGPLSGDLSERPAGLLSGPSILHVHLPTAASFRAKYLRVAEGPDEGRPFPPSPLEASACELIRSLRAQGASAADLEHRLDELYGESCAFEARQVELLELAGLLITPDLGPGRLLAEAACDAAVAASSLDEL